MFGDSASMAYRPNPVPAWSRCDSYFVEDHEDDEGVYVRAAEQRRICRLQAAAIQSRIADDLSKLTSEEYFDDVLDHMESMEQDTLPDVNSIDIQTEIQWFMRPYLLDFLLEAHHEFRLLPETLFLAVNLLDRYCSRRVVYKRHYQLVGCAALLIAAKYGDRKEHVPTIRELKLMCCSLYDDDMFTQMEWHVLQTLNWMVGHPTVPSFLELTLSESGYNAEAEHMATYISESALYHKEFLSVLPSVMARSSLALARYILGQPQEQTFEWAANYDADVAFELMQRLATPSQALARKYASPHLSSVSTIFDLFMQQRAFEARPSVAYVPLQVMQPQQVPTNAYCEPQTPQKPAYAMPANVLTPPITPEKGYDMMDPVYSDQQNILPQLRQYTTLPTPPSSVEHQPYHYQQTFVQQDPYAYRAPLLHI